MDTPAKLRVAQGFLRRQPRFAEIVRTAARPTPATFLSTRTPFQMLCRAIAGQQLSGQAARTIFDRFARRLGGISRITSDRVLTVPEADLRACGLSRAKTLAILDCAERCRDGTVPNRAALARLPDEAIIERMVQIRGVGVWTAQMLLIFGFARPDVWPVDDLGVRKGWSLLHGLGDLPSARDLAAQADPLRPHRSLVAWYCWRAAEAAALARRAR